MATSGSTTSLAESARREVSCPVCFEFLVDAHVPKDLACPHTCCQVCLQNLVSLNPGQPITCPMRCSKKTHVPAGGVKNLRTNLKVRNLAELHSTHVNGTETAVPKCEKHKENMHLYCAHCNALACQNCVILYHKGTEHGILDVGDTAKEQKEELKTIISDTQTKIKVYQKSTAELKNIEAGVLEAVEAEKQKIDKSRDEFIEAVKKESERLKLEVQSVADAKLSEIRTQLPLQEEGSVTLQAACDVAKRTSEFSDHAYITQHSDLVEKMKKDLVNVEQQDPLPADFSPRTAWFVNSSAKFGNIVGLQQEIGKFEAKCNALYVDCSKDGLLAVSDSGGKQVPIYEKENEIYEKKLSLQLNTINKLNPRGIVFCPDGKLWVARVTGIEVYSPTGKYQKTISTKQDTEMPHDGPPSKKRKKKTAPNEGTCVTVCSLAITADGSKILAGDIERNVITVHDLTGNIIRTLKTTIRPCELAVIKDTHVAASDWKPGNLVVMNIKTGQESLGFDIDGVNALGYDKYSNSLVIGRKIGGKAGMSGVIEMYCWKTGRKIACIAEKLCWPTGVTVTSDGLVVVGDTKTVKIYKVI